MNQKNNDFLEKDKSNSNKAKKLEKLKDGGIIKKINLLSSEQINYFINNLSSPRFLGSIHMKKQTSQHHGLINDVLKNNMENKLLKYFKNPLNNPITITLILSMIFFNILWIIFIYIF